MASRPDQDDDADPAPRSSHWWDDEGDEPDPRWSLANERTFLAYNRTALALVVAGLAVSGSHAAATDAPLWVALLGIPLMALGAYVSLMGRQRMIDAQRAMRLGEPMPRPPVRAVLTYGIAGIAAVAIVAAAISMLLH